MYIEIRGLERRDAILELTCRHDNIAANHCASQSFFADRSFGSKRDFLKGRVKVRFYELTLTSDDSKGGGTGTDCTSRRSPLNFHERDATFVMYRRLARESHEF